MISTSNFLRANVVGLCQCKVACVVGLMTLSSLVDASAAELSPAKKIYQGVTPLQWSVRMADSEIDRLGDSLDWKPDGRAKWDYAAGLFTLSLLELNVCAPDTNYVSFSEKAIGSFITADGNIKKYRPA